MIYFTTNEFLLLVLILIITLISFLWIKLKWNFYNLKQNKIIEKNLIINLKLWLLSFIILLLTSIILYIKWYSWIEREYYISYLFFLLGIFLFWIPTIHWIINKKSINDSTFQYLNSLWIFLTIWCILNFILMVIWYYK